MKKHRTIASKITGMLLTSVFAAMLLIGGVSTWSLYSMKEISQESSKVLGETAAIKAEEALEDMAIGQLRKIAIEKASRIEAKFDEVKAYVNGIAELAEQIYENPEAYPDRWTSLPKQGSTQLAAQLLWSYRLSNPTPEQVQEVLKLGNIQDMLVQYNANSDMVSSAYVATKSGWMLLTDYIAYSKYASGKEIPDFFEADSRQWFIKAAEAMPGEIIYSDVIFEFYEGKECMVCARPIYCDGEVVGVAGVESYLDTVSEAVLKTKIGEEGYGFLVNEKAQVMVSPKKKGETAVYAGQYGSLTDSENAQLAALAQDMTVGNSNVAKLILDGKEVYLAYAPLNGLGWSFAAVIDVEEVVAPATVIQDSILNLADMVSGQQDKAILKTVTIFLLITGTAAAAVSLAGMKMTGKITEPIRRLTWDVEKIGRGNLDYKIDITTGDEIQDLGDAFNTMTDQMQQYINNLAAAAKEKARIRTELLLAAKLQEDMLADSSRELINRKEFILHARMTPAKEVGGDFYDFFLIDEDHLVLLAADVSGKGVPAALFMMIAKILIQNNMSSAENPGKALEAVNQGLCRNNKNEMFVTAWIGVLTLSTGIMTFVNAGHTRPLLMQNQGRFRYLTEFSGLVLAGMEDTKYCQFQLQLQQGDVIFLYTDGVTEANDSAGTFFGEERLEVCVNQNQTASPQELCQAVWEDVLRFQGEAEQYDDITMLALKYCKPQA